MHQNISMQFLTYLLSVNASVILHPFEEITFLLSLLAKALQFMGRGGLPPLLPTFARQNSIFLWFFLQIVLFCPP